MAIYILKGKWYYSYNSEGLIKMPPKKTIRMEALERILFEMREWHHCLSHRNHLSTQFLLAASFSYIQRGNKFILCSYQFLEVTCRTHSSDLLTHFIDTLYPPAHSNLLPDPLRFCLNRLLQPGFIKVFTNEIISLGKKNTHFLIILLILLLVLFNLSLLQFLLI